MSVQRTGQTNDREFGLPDVIWPSRDQARQMFDEIARTTVGMSGDEFLRKLDAGEFTQLPDDWEHMPFVELAMMSGFGR